MYLRTPWRIKNIFGTCRVSMQQNANPIRTKRRHQRKYSKKRSVKHDKQEQQLPIGRAKDTDLWCASLTLPDAGAWNSLIRYGKMLQKLHTAETWTPVGWTESLLSVCQRPQFPIVRARSPLLWHRNPYQCLITYRRMWRCIRSWFASLISKTMPRYDQTSLWYITSGQTRPRKAATQPSLMLRRESWSKPLSAIFRPPTGTSDGIRESHGSIGHTRTTHSSPLQIKIMWINDE